MNDLTFIHDAEKHQFRLMMGDEFALIDYTIREGRWYLVHSEVPYDLRGQGIGKVLVEKTFEYIEAHQIDAVAVCSYIKLVAQRSPKWRNVIG